MMGTENHERFREMIPAAALGCLDAGEAQTIARHVATCPECHTEQESYLAVGDALALAVPLHAPPPELRRRVLARAAGTSNPASQAQAVRRTASPRPLMTRRAWPALAIIGLAALVLGGLLWASLAGLIPARSTVFLLPTDYAPEAGGELRFDRDAATLEVNGLPPLPVGQQYQLWLVAGEERDSGALFLPDAGGWAQVPVDLGRPANRYNAFGITVEPAGGSPGPTGERVLGSR